MLMLRRTLNSRESEIRDCQRITYSSFGVRPLRAPGLAWLVKLVLPPMHPTLQGAVILGIYGLVFLAATFSCTSGGLRGVFPAAPPRVMARNLQTKGYEAHAQNRMPGNRRYRIHIFGNIRLRYLGVSSHTTCRQSSF
jgi:hypothetical protein